MKRGICREAPHLWRHESWVTRVGSKKSPSARPKDDPSRGAAKKKRSRMRGERRECSRRILSRRRRRASPVDSRPPSSTTVRRYSLEINSLRIGPLECSRNGSVKNITYSCVGLPMNQPKAPPCDWRWHDILPRDLPGRRSSTSTKWRKAFLGGSWRVVVMEASRYLSLESEYMYIYIYKTKLSNYPYMFFNYLNLMIIIIFHLKISLD